MDQENQLTDRLRDRILNALHRGSLRPGDRLPSIRTLWKEMGVDHRVIAQAYRTLEAEGLVQVRGRSGVYVAPQEALGGELLAETARWMAGVMVEGWKRHIPIFDLPELLRRCTSTRRLRCACVESNVDQMTAYCTELREHFGLEPVPVYVSPVPLPRPDRSVEFFGVQDRLREVDVAVSTVYHARMVRKAAEDVGTPAVTLTVNAEVVEAVQRRLRETHVTVVAVDAAFGDRIRAMYDETLERPDQIRVILAGEADRLAALDPDEPLMLTRAARERIGDIRNPLLVPHSPTLSPQTARELLEVLIRLNVGDKGVRPPGYPEAEAATLA
ncbi:MAG: DNA-binding transcriptional regulator YhcF, GntR family [Gemmatimonadetes bacterium]|nr:DNA-binding transcriptional regulator YhcF, GntR family [Gemmatimonadota bacterium]